MIKREDLLSGTRREVGERVLLTVENHFQGYEIVDYKGMVWGISMRSKDMAQDFFMTCKQMTGGELTSYTELADEGRQRAIDRMINMAKRIKANAVINFKFEQSLNTYGGNTEVTAFGNAVVIKPIKNYVPTGGLGNILVEFYDAYTKGKNFVESREVELPKQISEGEIIKKDGMMKIKCPYCGTLYPAELKNSTTIIISGLEDEDDKTPGQQIKCFGCSKIFTVPYSQNM